MNNPVNTQITRRAFDVESFKSMYQTFDNTMLQRLPDLYSEEIAFRDPIHQLKGMDALKRYFAGFFNPELECRFVFTNQIITDQQVFFQWQMHYRHPRLEHGRPLLLDGGTLIKFNSHIYYHQDFYDMGAMLYQHIPVLGWAVKKINANVVKSS